MDNERIDALCRECFEIGDTGTLTAFRDPDIWVLEFDDEAPCFLMPMEASGSMRLTGAVCPLPEENREAVYEMLLLGNELNATGDGTCLGIDQPDGDVILSVQLAMEALSPQELLAKLRQFRSAREIWAEVVLNGSPEEDALAAREDQVAKESWLRG